jgi:hypothetical protein
MRAAAATYTNTADLYRAERSEFVHKDGACDVRLSAGIGLNVQSELLYLYTCISGPLNTKALH